MNLENTFISSVSNSGSLNTKIIIKKKWNDIEKKTTLQYGIGIAVTSMR